MDSLAELFRMLDEQFTPEAKAEIIALDKSQLWTMHLGLNGLIRSLAFYKNESPDGKLYFARLGMPDGASHIFGELYWHHLQSLPINEDVIANLLEKNWFVMPEEVATISKELVSEYEQYRNH